MTKKPSEKNKAWEKDRRDRLNKSFEELAKLLPKYDPSITWSKIEIIQKSISHIKELHERHEDYLRDKNPEILKEHNDLIDALNCYQARNGQLSDLLKKAKITLPVFKLPKFLIDNPQYYFKNGQHTKFSSTNEIKIKSIGRPGKYINKTATEINSTTATEKDITKAIATVSNSSNQITLQQQENHELNGSIQVTDDKQQIQQNTETIQIFTESEVKQEHSVVQNEAILTTGILVPLVPLKPIETIQQTTNLLTIPVPIQNVAEIPLTTPLSVTTSSSIKSKSTTFIKLSSSTSTSQRFLHQIQQNSIKKLYRKIARDKDGRIKILPQPRLKVYFQRSDGKVPIPVLKKYGNGNVPLKRKRRRKRKVSTTIAEQIVEIAKENSENNMKKRKLEENDNEKEEKKDILLKVEKLPESEIIDKTKVIQNVEEKDTSEEGNKNIDLNINQNENDNAGNSLQKSSNGSVSPTAAFLQSFPVVTTTTTSTITAIAPISQNDSIDKCDSTENKNNTNVLEKLSNNEINDESFTKNDAKIENTICNKDPIQTNKVDMNFIMEKTISQVSIKEENIQNSIKQGIHQDLAEALEVLQTQTTESESNVIIPQLSSSLTLPIPITTKEFSNSDLPCSSSSTVISTRRNSFSTYKQMPICTPLPLPVPINITNNTPVSKPPTSIPITISNTNSVNSHEPLPVSVPNLNFLSTTTTVSIFPSIAVSSHSTNFSCSTAPSIVETTWCSLNTIPTTDIIRKDDKIFNSQHSSNSGLQNENIFVPPTTITQNISSFSSCSQPVTTKNSNSVNVDNNLINISNQQNLPQLQTVAAEQNSNLIFTKVTSSPSLTFNTPPLATTIATTTSSKKRQNSRKSNKAKQQTTPLPILATPSLPIQNLPVCSSNTLQKNTTVCVTSPSTTSSLSFSSSSSSISPSPLSKNQQQIYSTFPGPEIPSVSNSYSQNFTNPYSNFPPQISHPPCTTVASQFQSYSNNQSMKYTSSVENTVFSSSSNDTRQKSDNNSMCVPQFKTPQPKVETITSVSHQSKLGNFIYNPSQLKYGNVNHVLQSKTGGTIVSHHSSEFQKPISSAIIENLNTPSMPPRVQTPAPGFSQGNKPPTVTTYPQSIVNKHYHHAPPPSNTGEFLPLPSVSSGYQHSSTTMNLPPNRSSVYPIVVSNSSELNLSPHCPNTFSRTTISNNLPIYPLANNTTTSSFLFPSTYIQMPPGTMTNQLHTYPPANIISTTFVATTTTSSLVYTMQQPKGHSKDNVLPLHYPNAPFSVNVCTASPSTNNDFPLKQTTVTSPSTTSSPYLSYPPTPTSNVVFSTISSTPSSIHSSPSKQAQKTIPTNIQSQNTKDSLILPPSTSVTTSYVTGTNTSKQTSSFKSYQPVVSHPNPIKSYTSQQSTTLPAPVTISSSIPPSPMQCTPNSQNNLILNPTSSNYTQNFSTNSNTISSPSTSFAPPKTKMTNSIPKTSSNITPICPSITPSLYSNYPPPSLTPLPPPLLSTVIPTSNTSFSSFPQNSGVSAFVEPVETLKYPVTSSVAPIQNYNKTSNLQSSLTFVNKSVESFISAVSPNPVYTNTSQASSNPNYSASNTFGPPNSDSLYSPVKNYYYHPIQVQETPNFSFSLTSSANTPPIVSPNPPPHMLPPSVKPDSLPWMPHPPPPPSINANNYKSSFTFSLTPSTTTVYNSIANSPTTSSLTNRSFTNTTSTQKASSTKSILPSKAKGNYNNSMVPKSQSSAVTTTTAATSYATNFTFSLTQSKNSLTNSENCRNGKSNTLNDFPPPQQQQQQQHSYDHYNMTPDLQNKRNLSATNFSFALTKTTSSNNVISNRIAAQQPISSTTTTLTTTNSTPSFSTDTTLNQPSSNLCGTQNMNNVKSTPTVTEAEQIQRNSSNVFKKPLIESSLPNKESSSSSASTSSQNQNYYTYDQKLQKSSSSLNQQRIPVNWMAPPPPPSDYGAPSLVDYGCLPNYPSTATSASQPPQNFDYNTRKSDLYYPPFPSTDDNFPSWSPNKMLDTATSHLVNTSSMNLGNYYGGEISSFSGPSGTNIPVSSGQTPQNSNKSSYSTTNNNNNNSGDKTLSGNVKDFKDSNNGPGVSSNIQSSCNQNNFLSVSQLVDQESNISNIQKNYENCPNTNINSNKKNQSSSSSSSSSNKSKDTKKFNTSITFPSLGSEQGNTSTTPNTIPNSNNYSAEALLTKKDKNIRNYSNVCNPPDFYGTINTPQTLYSSSSSTTTSLMPDPSIEPNYFYPNYATNAGTCLTDTDYLGSIYPNETNYSRSQSIKPVIRKISSTTSIPPPVAPQSHHHHHPHHPVTHHAPPPPSTNFVPYDANYYPVPLGVNSPLMPGPAPPPPPHHHTSDPYGAGSLTPTPSAYIHSSPKFHHHQTPHSSWTSKSSTTPTNPIHHQYNLQDQHLFTSTVDGSNNTGTSTSNNGSQQNAQNNPNSSGTTTGGGSVANSSGSGGGNNLTNFNLTTICPEINNEKVGSNPW